MNSQSSAPEAVSASILAEIPSHNLGYFSARAFPIYGMDREFIGVDGELFGRWPWYVPPECVIGILTIIQLTGLRTVRCSKLPAGSWISSPTALPPFQKLRRYVCRLLWPKASKTPSAPAEPASRCDPDLPQLQIRVEGHFIMVGRPCMDASIQQRADIRPVI